MIAPATSVGLVLTPQVSTYPRSQDQLAARLGHSGSQREQQIGRVRYSGATQGNARALQSSGLSDLLRGDVEPSR